MAVAEATFERRALNGQVLTFLFWQARWTMRLRIEVVGTKHGVATMLDKDVLVYAIGLLQDRVARGEAPSRTVSFRAADDTPLPHIDRRDPSLARKEAP